MVSFQMVKPTHGKNAEEVKKQLRRVVYFLSPVVPTFPLVGFCIGVGLLTGVTGGGVGAVVGLVELPWLPA